ncbi:MAG: flavin reductase family protein [Candidatus Methanofastidiosia archaeon]
MDKKNIRAYTALFPNPVVLVSCGTMAKPNIITIAWAATACLNPPTLTIAVRPQRYSHKLILKSCDFVANIPRACDVEKVDYCGNVSGRDHDKFKECGFTPKRSLKVNSPGIRECPVNIECKIAKTITLGTHDLFIGEIVNVATDENILDAANKADPDMMDTLVYAQGGYYNLGNKIGKYGFSLK